MFTPEHFAELARRLKVCRARLINDCDDDEDVQSFHAVVDQIAIDFAQELPPGLPQDSIIDWVATTGSPNAKRYKRKGT